MTRGKAKKKKNSKIFSEVASAGDERDYVDTRVSTVAQDIGEERSVTSCPSRVDRSRDGA